MKNTFKKTSGDLDVELEKQLTHNSIFQWIVKNNWHVWENDKKLGEKGTIDFIDEFIKYFGGMKNFTEVSLTPTNPIKLESLNFLKIKDCILRADLEFHQQPFAENQFNDWLSFVAQKICEEFGAPRDECNNELH